MSMEALVVVLVLQRPYIWPAIALEVSRNTLQLPYKGHTIALRLAYICPAFGLHLPYDCPTTAQQLPCNCTCPPIAL